MNFIKKNISTVLIILITIVFLISANTMSNRLTTQSDTIDSLRMELEACDMENNLFGSLLNQINKTDSNVLINAIETLEKTE
jgi:hypothetical protein